MATHPASRIPHRRSRRVVAPLAVVLLAAALVLVTASCAAAPTPLDSPAATDPAASPTGPTSPPPTFGLPTPRPTDEFSATPSGALTAAPTPTPTLAPGILPDWIAPCLCIGLFVHPSDGDLYLLDPSRTEYHFANGRLLTVSWTTIPDGYGGLIDVVRSYRIEGADEMVPKPDETPVQDEAVVWNGHLIPGGDGVKVDDFLGFLGTPTTDTGIETDNWALGPSREITYPGLELNLTQLEEATDKSLWTVNLVVDGPSFVTPRGLRTGLTATEVLSLFSTGAFAITVTASEKGIRGIEIDGPGVSIGVLVQESTSVVTGFNIDPFC